MLKPWNDDGRAANGSAVRENFVNWFDCSQVVDEKREPLVVYHGTLKSFPAFGIGDVGFHFGSVEQAESRLGVLTQGLAVEGENIIPVYLSIKNPLRMPDAGSWDCEDTVANRLGDLLVDDDGLHAKYEKARETLPESANMRDLFEAMGYDGIVYANSDEAEGAGDSWIAFRATQVKSAVGNSGLYLQDNPSLADEGYEIVLLHAHQAKIAIEQMTGKSSQKVALC